MKRTTILMLFVLSVAAVAMAGPVSLSKATTIARQYASRSSNVRRAPQVLDLQLAELRTASIELQGMDDYPLYYVFNKGNESGFVIVSGDDRMRSVIAETNSGAFDADNVNPNFQWWLDAVAETAERIAQTDNDNLYYTESTSANAVDSLIMTKWNQKAPYNNLCPMFDDGRSLTGCVATAMAQVFYYLKYPEKGVGKVNYTSSDKYNGKTYTVKLTDDLANYPFEYDNMQLTYGDTYTDEAGNAVAKLMYSCGLAVHMYYTPGSSGSVLTYSVLTDTFALDKSCKYACRNFYTDDEWHQILKDEFDAGRPVLYSGHQKDVGGHQFICDGYNADGLFHFNWGWGGAQDGYFDVDAIRFNLNQDIAYNLKANENGKEDTSNDPYIWYGSIGLTKQKLPYTVSLGENFLLDIYNYYHMWKDFSGYIGTALYSGEELIETLLYDWEEPAGMGGTLGELEFALPSDLSDGIYTLRVVYGYSEDDLHPIKNNTMVEGTKYIIVSVKDGKAILSDPRKTISESSGYASFSAPCNVTVPEGVTVYKAKTSSDGTSVVLTDTKADIIPANEGVILYHNGGGTYTFDISDDDTSADFSDNELIATTVQSTVPTDGTYYGLKANEASFAKLQGGLVLSSGKAYIALDSDSGAKSLSITFTDDDTNGIISVDSQPQASDNSYYTLQGLRVEKPTTGLYINNGKKLIIK